MQLLKHSAEAEQAALTGYRHAIQEFASCLDMSNIVPNSSIFDYDFLSDIEENISKHLRKMLRNEAEDLEHLFEE